MTMSFVQGLVGAYGIGEFWNSQKLPPKVYFEGKRIHHYEVGIVLFLVGAILRSPTIAGVGAGLFLHDIDDARL